MDADERAGREHQRVAETLTKAGRPVTKGNTASGQFLGTVAWAGNRREPTSFPSAWTKATAGLSRPEERIAAPSRPARLAGPARVSDGWESVPRMAAAQAASVLIWRTSIVPDLTSTNGLPFLIPTVP